MSSTNNIIHRIASITAVIAGTFSLFVTFQLTADYTNMTKTDPLNLPAIEQLRIELRNQTTNDAIKTEIRNLDMITRRAYFSSLAFRNTGSLILVISIIITLIALKTVMQYTDKTPQPGKFLESDPLLHPSNEARRTILLSLFFLLFISLFFAYRSKLAQSPDNDAQGNIDLALTWPCFRGPGGLGVAHFTNAPLEWDGSTGKNILWKTPVPGIGFSSPIVLDGKVFITCGDNKIREVLCFDADTGTLLWRKDVGPISGTPAKLPEINEDTSFAAPTMATDGRNVFAIFATGNVVCFDQNGIRQWTHSFGLLDNPYGHASSLITWNNLLIVQIDETEKGRVTALNTETGLITWETPRKGIGCWASPIIAETSSGPQLILTGNPYVRGYAPSSGEELWQIECMGGEVAPSPAFADDVVYAASEYERLAAIKQSHSTAVIAWESEDDLPDVSSPLAAMGFVFISSSSGIVSCYEAQTGKLQWNHEFPSAFYSSPVLVGKNVFLMDKKGVTHIFAAAAVYKPLAENKLDEEATCVPAFMDGKIYIRGLKNLYCIGTK